MLDAELDCCRSEYMIQEYSCVGGLGERRAVRMENNEAGYLYGVLI